MTQYTEVLTDIPDANIASVKAQFEAAGATVTVTKQSNGFWTLTAVYTVP